MIIGTAGHIDHGKTSLVKALTGVDTDRLKEEKARGITIDLGFAYLPAPDGDVIGFIDVPGHERFVHTMLAGAGGIDLVLLVVAADDAIKPQTLEHLAIIDLLGIGHGLVALTKADLVPPERRVEVETQIRATLAGTGLADVEILPVSSVTGEGVDTLRQRLFDAASSLPARAADGRFRLAVDRCFTLAGAGTVVTGTVLTGKVAVGDQVLVSPSGLEARIRSIHAQNRASETGVAGQRCALSLVGRDIAKDAIARGDMVLDPSLHAPTDRIDATLRLLPSATKPVGTWFPVRLHHAATEIGARLVPLDVETITPGSSARVQLVLDRPIAAAAADAFVVRDTSAQHTLGGGRFLDLRAPARKRRTPERLAQLDAMALADPAASLSALLDVLPYSVELTGFTRDRALVAGADQALAKQLDLVTLPVPSGLLALSAKVWTGFERSLTGTLEVFHAENPDIQGIGFERLRLQLSPRLAAAAFRAALNQLAQQAKVALEGAWVRLPGHEVRLTPEDEKVWARMAPLLDRDERFRPPRVRDMAGILDVPEPEIRRICKRLGRMGKLDEVAHDHFFLRATVAEMVGIVQTLSADGGQFTAAQFRDQVDNGRKVAIQILEFFDRHGVTLRRGDLRRVNTHRLDLFGSPV